MSLIETIKQSLGLLTATDRTKFYLAGAFQVLLGLLDLVGVLLIGLVGAAAVSVLQSGQLPLVLQGALQSLGWAPSSGPTAILALASIAAILLIGKSAAATLGMRRVVSFLASRQAVLAGDLSRRLLGGPLSTARMRSSQETVYALMQGANAMSLFVLAQAIVVAAEVSSLVMVAVALIAVNPLIALTAIVSFVLMALAIHFLIGPRASNAGQTLAQADVQSLEAIQEALDSFREVSIWRKQQFYSDKIFAARLESARASSDLMFLSLLPKYMLEAGLVLVGSLVAVFLFATQSAEVAAASLAVFVAAATRIIPSILRLQGAALVMRNTSGAVERTLQLAYDLEFSPADDPPRIVPQVPASSLAGDAGDERPPKVTLTDVVFTYPGQSTPAVAAVNLVVGAGNSLALVGPSGAGKSTLADLMMGLLVPDSGQLHLNVDGAESVAEVRATRIAYVPQQVTLLRASVLENVAFGIGLEEADRDLAIESLARVGLHPQDFGKQGLATQLGGPQSQVSGGQKQRIGIARALYARPSLLVLDEATSALDAATEDIVTKTLAALHGAVTVVVIAHRLSTVQHCDQVAYMQEGVVVAQGSFEELRTSVPDFDVQATLLGL